MVNYRDALDETFGALSHPARRAILTRLEQEDGCSVSELARPLSLKLPAVMKHLEVLANARLIRRTKLGRTVTVRLHPRPLRQAQAWFVRYERFWSRRLDRLVAFAEGTDQRGRAAHQ